MTDNAVGIAASGTDCLIVRNSAHTNAINFDVAIGNNLGAIQTTPVGAGPWDNFDF